MISAIEITNWKTHKKTKLNFQKGVNVLIGVMGAGKTSVMDAISFGLFGTFPALNSKRVNLSGLITNRPSAEEEAEVKIYFELGNDEYVCTRKISSKEGNTAKLEKNGKHLQTQQTKVNEEIENILKIDYDTFSRVIYAEQNRLDYFLELPKGDRKKQIDHMLGLDSFSTAEENTTSLINSIKAMISYEEDALQRIDMDELSAQLKKLIDERSKTEKEQQKLTEKQKEVQKEIEKTKTKLDEIKQQYLKKNKLSEEVAKLTSKISTLNNEIKKITELKLEEKEVEREADRLSKQVETSEKELSQLKKEERNASQSLSNTEASIKEIEKALKERDRLIKDAKGDSPDAIIKKLNAESEKLQETTNILAQHIAKKKEIQEWKKELSKHLSKCPVCERELDDNMRDKLLAGKSLVLEELDSSITNAEKSVSSKRKEIEELNELRSKLEAIHKMLKKYENIDKDIVDQRKERDKQAKEVEKLQEKLERVNKEYDLAKEQRTKLTSQIDNLKRKRTLESEIKKENEILEAKKHDLAAIEVDDKLIDSMQDAFTKQSSTLSTLVSDLSNIKKYSENIEGQITEKEKQSKSFKEMQKRIENKRNQLANLNKFKAALVDTEALLRNRLVSSINSLMLGLWPDIYPYLDYTALKLEARKDDYLLQVNSGTNANGEETWLSVDSVASGGERSIACLTMRIALSMVIVPNLKWLILDEPTHNIDSTGIGKLIDVLGNSLPNVVDQIFIITHDDNLKQINSAKVYLLDRDKGVAAPTSTTEL